MLADEHKDAFRIGVVGPSRVGKTSLISAILRDSQDLLAGTPVEVQPEDHSTEARLSRYGKLLDGSLHAGQFVPAAMHSTQEPFVFILNMFAGNRDAGLKMAILDYPGGWLDPEHRPRLRGEEWKDCREFIEQSTVLIVPIDAAVVMEAAEPRHRAAVPGILTTGEVLAVARSWAKKRNEREDDEPGLLVLSPLKCESYFADNYGLRDNSNDLAAAVREAYAELIKVVHDEAHGVKILYAPVDTIGCVELVSADWHAAPASPGDLEFTAKYRVRQPRKLSIKGADGPLIVVCKHLAEARGKVEKLAASKSSDAAESARAYAERHEGLLKNMWFRLNGERTRREEAAGLRSEEATRVRSRADAFEQAVVDLSKRPLGSRVVEL